MRALLLGPTGGVGRLLLAEALDRGLDVGAVSRTALEPRAGLRAVVGSPLDPDALREAGQGATVVFSALGLRRASFFPWSPLTSPPDLTERVARLIVGLAPEMGWKTVIVVSAAGVGDSAPAMNPAMRWLVKTSTIGLAYRDLENMENVFSGSDLDWHACRPVTLVEGPTGPARPVHRFTATSRIGRAQVASWMLDRAAAETRKPRTPMIAG